MGDWSEKAAYLRQSRLGMWNEDYMAFLVREVWKIRGPVEVADFGCGLGCLGGLLLPLLPVGSRYTGFDREEKLLDRARALFAGAPFPTRFERRDLLTEQPETAFDLVVCQAFLMHQPDPMNMLARMVRAVRPGGRVICMEVNWNISNAALYVDGADVDAQCNLGLLQKLWAEERRRSGVDRCIGTKLPVYMRRLGLIDVGVRLSDCVRLLDPGDPEAYPLQAEGFLADWGGGMGERETVVQSLCDRGLTREEAEVQYACESALRAFIRTNRAQVSAVQAPALLISYGTRERDRPGEEIK